jgi:hypothetical protein
LTFDNYDVDLYLPIMEILRRADLSAWLHKRFGSAGALAAALGVSRQTAHNLITGQTNPNEKHCEKLGIIPAFLLPEKEIKRDMQSLDDFLTIRGHDRRQEGATVEAELSGAPLSNERGTAMWKGLIQVACATAKRVREIYGVPFEWDAGPPLGKSRSPLLRLEPVGAQFKEVRSTPFVGATRNCLVVFGWVATPMDSRKQTPPDLRWILTLSSNDGEFVWNVNQDEIIGASSIELAEQIVKRLIEYRDEYQKA